MPSYGRRRDMVVTGLDQLWVADITYIRLRDEFVFLAVILDAYRRHSLVEYVYLQRATEALRSQGPFDDALLPYLSPLGWEHINLTGYYVWRSRSLPPSGRFRPLRSIGLAA